MMPEQLAQNVGVTFSTVNSWEDGKRKAPSFLVRHLFQIGEELSPKRSNEEGSNRKQR